jgi:DNA-binding transcriptional LysR family regulator
VTCRSKVKRQYNRVGLTLSISQAYARSVLDIHRLRLLLEFAERGTIAATAAALGYTPSAVSQQLAALERETAAALLDRTARAAELTEAGKRLAAHAAEILALIEAAEADLAAPEPVGRVAISAFPTAAVAFAPALTRTVRAHPGLSLLLRQTAGGEVLRQVKVGQVDVAIVDDWTGRLAGGPPALRFFPLVTDPLVLVVPRGHWASDPRAPISLHRLRDEPWLATPAGEASRRAVDQVLAAAGGVVVPPSEFEGLATILSLVARGIGIAILPGLTLAAGDARVAVRDLPGTRPARDLYAVARASSVRRPAVAVIIRALTTAARGLPGGVKRTGEVAADQGRGTARPAAGESG